jgi:ketosteroid isomerase-like protein
LHTPGELQLLEHRLHLFAERRRRLRVELHPHPLRIGYESSVHPHEELIQTFYRAFQKRDADAMAACYHPEIEFSDEAFPLLRGARAGDMWRMLCSRSKDLAVEFRDVHADAGGGRAHWDATYTFSKTGRRVVNRIDATFAFRDGKIVRHVDRFDFWRWSRQALGPVGLLLGWTPIVRRAVRRQAAEQLDAWTAALGSRK